MGEVLVFELPLEAWISIFMLVMLLMVILYIWILIRAGRLKKRLNNFLNHSNVAGLEGIIDQLHEKSDRLEERNHSHEKQIQTLQHNASAVKGNVGIIRYNAFHDLGSDLSFSVAFVDDEENGVVISAIHSREDSLVYAKPVEKGSSSYVLMPEEKEAIRLAIQKKKL